MSATVTPIRVCSLHGPFPGAICTRCAEPFAQGHRESPGPAMALELADILVENAQALATLARLWREEGRRHGLR